MQSGWTVSEKGFFHLCWRLKRRKEAAGERVIDLSVGTPNIPPAPHIREALCRAAADEKNYVYAINDQKARLEAVAFWYKRRYGVELDPSSEICSLLGSQEGLSHIALSIVDEGETVLVPDPCYPVFADGPLIAGAKLAYMPQKKENGYVIQLQDIPEETARAAKLMVVSYPNNPTTALAPDRFYEELIDFARPMILLCFTTTPIVSWCLTEKRREAFCGFRELRRWEWNLTPFLRPMGWQAPESVSASEIRMW